MTFKNLHNVNKCRNRIFEEDTLKHSKHFHQSLKVVHVALYKIANTNENEIIQNS